MCHSINTQQPKLNVNSLMHNLIFVSKEEWKKDVVSHRKAAEKEVPPYFTAQHHRAKMYWLILHLNWDVGFRRGIL